MALFQALRHSWLFDSVFNFENDAVGSSPSGWVNNDSGLNISAIIKKLSGHENVLAQYQPAAPNFADLQHTFTAGAQDLGTIEFYIDKQDVSSGLVGFYLHNAVPTEAFHIDISGGNLRSHNAGGVTIIAALTNRILYHISVRFRGSGAAYQGLNNNEYEVWIDGIEYGPYTFVNNVDPVRIQLLTSGGGQYTYWDAFGWDWDDDYDIGDNLNDTEDITDDIINARIEEELYQISEGWIIVKGDAFSYLPGHEIDFYDSDNVLSWIGIILTPEYNIKGSGSSEYVSKIKLIGLSSYYDAIYRKNYTTARSSDFILKDIIDTFLTKYHSYTSLIDDFSAIEYKYDLKKPILKMLYYCAMLERAVAHNLPNGEVFFNAYDNLMSMFDKYYQGSGGFNEEEDEEALPDWIDTDDSEANCTATIEATVLDGHKNYLELDDQNAAGNVDIYHNYPSVEADRIIEIWVAVSDITVGASIHLWFYEDAAHKIAVRINEDDIQNDNGGGSVNFKAGFISNDIFIHIKFILDDSANTFDCYINSVLEGNDLGYLNNSAIGINKIRLQTSTGNSGYKVYVDGPGLVGEEDPNGLTYVEGDNLGFTILEHLVAEKFAITKYVPAANRYITRVPVIGAYNSNGQVYVVGVATTKAADEEQFGIRQLQAWRDPEITNYTEADQLATNLQIIYFMDTQFIHVLSQGRGHIQVGYTMKVRSTLKFEIVAEEFLCLMRIWHPTTDLCEFVLSDNILSEAMFNRKVSQKLYDVEAQQSYEDSDVSEMAADGVVTPLVSLARLRSIIGITNNEHVGYGVRLINKTGVASVKGTIVEAHTNDFSFKVADASSNHAIGIVYNDGVPDGSECLIINNGQADVLLKDATASTAGNWTKTSDVAGRANATGGSPAAAPTHFLEIGHCCETKAADIDVLAEHSIQFL